MFLWICGVRLGALHPASGLGHAHVWFRVNFFICRGPFGAIIANLGYPRPPGSTPQGFSKHLASHESSVADLGADC